MNGRLLLGLMLLSAGCAQHAPRATRPSRGKLLNPLLSIEAAGEFRELRPFEHKVKKIVDDAKAGKHVTDIAVYFRDLDNGPLFTLNPQDKFTPASLMKVPLMMAVLKEAEKNPALLRRRIRNNLPQMGFESRALKRDADYTVDELLRAMIAWSDNDAVIMLRTVVGDEPLNEVFRDFGLVIPEVRSLDDSMSVREYATFFRILYNASYLDEDMSEKALEYLAASEFKHALAAGVPPGVVVAHKYGERSFEEKSIKQLHDCGIVYHPSNPYVVCIMTRGEDSGKLTAIIKDISKTIFDSVDSQALIRR